MLEQSLKNQIENSLKIHPEFIESVQSLDQLLKLVTEFVQELIDKDFEKLLLTLYRIDVSEQKIKKALDGTSPENAAKEIAQLVLEREMQKFETRKKYSSEEQTDWEFDI